MKRLSADDLFSLLKSKDLSNQIGKIVFTLANVTVVIKSTDTIGMTLQSWLEQFLLDNNIYFATPENTQQFPDFILDDTRPNDNLLELKAFMYKRSPAFDIANFESYCDSVKEKVYRLDANYLIFGYDIDQEGNIKIVDMWLKKIWEICGDSSKYPLKTQVKRGMIYNIRPESNFKYGKDSTFKNKDEFLCAVYHTLRLYKGDDFANDWLSVLKKNYKNYYGYDLVFSK